MSDFIDDSMIEAAAAAMWNTIDMPWSECHHEAREQTRGEARAALEAVLPMISQKLAAAPRDDGWRTMDDPELERVKEAEEQIQVLGPKGQAIVQWSYSFRGDDRKTLSPVWEKNVDPKKYDVPLVHVGHWIAMADGEWVSDGGHDSQPVRVNPTNWRPLPSPPSSGSEAER